MCYPYFLFPFYADSSYRHCRSHFVQEPRDLGTRHHNSFHYAYIMNINHEPFGLGGRNSGIAHLSVLRGGSPTNWYIARELAWVTEWRNTPLLLCIQLLPVSEKVTPMRSIGEIVKIATFQSDGYTLISLSSLYLSRSQRVKILSSWERKKYIYYLSFKRTIISKFLFDPPPPFLSVQNTFKKKMF